MRRALAFLAVALMPAAAPAREALGTFATWAAFRDLTPPRCYAIGEPDVADGAAATGAFVAVATWPAAGARGQVHVRLAPGAGVGRGAVLSVGERRFALVRAGRDAWAADPAADAAIAAALRSGEAMTIVARGAAGGRYTDVYPLPGLATAMDAAALACARR